MKRKSIWILALCALLVCAGCDNETGNEPEGDFPVAVESVTVEQSTLKLGVGEAGKLTATVSPDNADDKTITWSSSDGAIATVSNDGTVTAHTVGTAVITATAGGKEGTCKVTVHVHSYSTKDICSTCGAPKPTLKDGKIDYQGILTKYTGSEPNVVIPKGVTGIGYGAFRECTGLTSVTIPGSVTKIEGSAFNGCTGLTEVTIPGSVTSIGSMAFYECTGLKTVIYKGTLAQWCALDKDYYLMRYTETVTLDDIPNLRTKTEIAIPNGVESIGSSTFYGCTALTSVTIPNGVTSIGSNAFSGCTSLKTVTIPDNVTGIGRSAFEGCTSLASITIPGSVTSIGGSAFYECTGLKTVTYKGTLAQWCALDKDFSLMSYAETVTLDDIPNLKTETKLVIPNGVESIGNYAFYRCTSLASVTIPDSVTGIGNDAFSSCTKLTSVTIPTNVTSIGSNAFHWCTSLASVTIPDSVTKIGSYAFSLCSNLTTVNYGGTVTEWEKIERYSYKDAYADGLSDKTITGKDGSTWTAK